MLLGLLLDGEPICLNCAPGLPSREIARARRLYDDAPENWSLFCSRCADMLVDYRGLLDEDDLAVYMTLDD